MTKNKSAKWAGGIVILAVTIYLVFPYGAALLDGNRNTVSKLTPQKRTFDVDGRAVVAEVAVAPSSGRPSVAIGNGLFQQRKARLDQVVQFELLREFVVFEGIDPADTRDISVKVSSKDSKSLSKIVDKVAEEAYGVKILPDKRIREVFVVKQRATAKPLLQETHAGNGAHFIKPPVLNFKSSGITVAQMLKALSHVLQVAIVDETGLNGKYNIDFTFSDSSPESVMRDFATQAGLDVNHEEKLVDVFVVRPQE